jgi:DNA repair protein RadC
VAGAALASFRRVTITPSIDPSTDPPLRRERLWTHGPDRLSDTELVAIVLGTGVRGRPALTVAADVIAAAGGLSGLARAMPAELAAAHGVGEARAARLAAGFALGRRALEAPGRATLGGAGDVDRLLRPRVAGLAQEVFIVIGLDVRNRLLADVEVARGLLTGVEVHPREVFRPLIRMAAAGAVVAHNHPSGDPTPSAEDLALTRRLRAVGELVGIPVIDHVVIGRDGYRSIAEWLGTDL